MSEDVAALDESVLFSSIEEENNALKKQQVQSINDCIRKVRRISKQSQRALRTTVVDDVREAIAAREKPGFYVESPGRIEQIGGEIGVNDDEDTGQFCIPEPTPTETVASALSHALDKLELEKRSFRGNSSSPVLKRWKIL